MRRNICPLKLNLFRATIDAHHFGRPSLMTMQTDEGDGDVVGGNDRFMERMRLDHVAVTRD
jgi:hypothetical protein